MSMSALLKKELAKGRLTIQGRTRGQVAIVYYDKNDRRRQKHLRYPDKLEVVPRLTTKDRITLSNIPERVRAGSIRVVKGGD